MNPKAVEYCVRGAYFTSPVFEPMLVDCVAEGEGRLFLLSPRWWRELNWGLGAGLVLVEGTLADTDDYGLTLLRDDGNTGHLGEPDSAEQIRAADRMRLETDLTPNRGEYRDQLERLRDHLGPEFNESVTAYIDATDARPTLDPILYLAEQERRQRPVGRVVVRGEDDAKRGVLVVDEEGRAGVAGGDAWLRTVAADYTARTRPLPRLADYVNWLAGQNPHGPGSVGEPFVSEQTGTVADIAARMLAETP